MDPIVLESDRQDLSTGTTFSRPRASVWFWNPWYAKLWWVCIAAYWAGKLASFWSASLNDMFLSTLAGYLNIVFFPLTALLVLGAQFLPVWMDYHAWEWVAPSHDEMFPRRSIGGYLDPMADRLDPRSPKYLHRNDHH